MTDVVDERRRPAALEARARHAPAAARRGGAASSASSATTTRRSSSSPRPPASPQGTFYLYFDSKKAIFDELVRDLNRRVRHAMKEGSSQGATRLESELLGFEAYFRFTAEHPALYRIIRQAEFVSPEMLRYHYDRLSRGLHRGAARGVGRGRDRRRSTRRWRRTR